MIENYKQYEITKQELEKFRKALDSLDSSIQNEGKIISLITHAQRNGVLSIIEELEFSILEYESNREQCIIIPFPDKKN